MKKTGYLKRTPFKKKHKPVKKILGWEVIRKEILKRDSYQCRICFNEDIEKSLHIHHIDYDRDNNSLNNLVALCSSCHFRIHEMKYKPSLYPDMKSPWGVLEI